MAEYELIQALENIAVAINHLAYIYETEQEKRNERTEQLKDRFQTAISGALEIPPDLRSVT